MAQERKGKRLLAKKAQRKCWQGSCWAFRQFFVKRNFAAIATDCVAAVVAMLDAGRKRQML